jgi:hypothetical protein
MLHPDGLLPFCKNKDLKSINTLAYFAKTEDHLKNILPHIRRHDIQHNEIEDNGFQPNNIKHKNK